MRSDLVASRPKRIGSGGSQILDGGHGADGEDEYTACCKARTTVASRSNAERLIDHRTQRPAAKRPSVPRPTEGRPAGCQDSPGRRVRRARHPKAEWRTPGVRRRRQLTRHSVTPRSSHGPSVADDAPVLDIGASTQSGSVRGRRRRTARARVPSTPAQDARKPPRNLARIRADGAPLDSAMTLGRYKGRHDSRGASRRVAERSSRAGT